MFQIGSIIYLIGDASIYFENTMRVLSYLQGIDSCGCEIMSLHAKR